MATPRQVAALPLRQAKDGSTVMMRAPTTATTRSKKPPYSAGNSSLPIESFGGSSASLQQNSVELTLVTPLRKLDPDSSDADRGRNQPKEG